MFDVVVLTEKRFLAPDPHSFYISQIIFEESILLENFRNKGAKAERVDWADAAFDWTSAGRVLFRTPWNYHDHLDKFKEWLQKTKTQTRLINSANIIEWNLDKRYLLDLAAKNISVVPTLLFEKGTEAKLDEAFAHFACDELVIKPSAAAGGKETYRVTKSQAAEFQKQLARLLSQQAMVVQPFQPSILEKGETSLIVIDGKFTHAIRKTAGEGEFRIHEKYGGRVLPHQASAHEIAFAEKVAAACPEQPHYARIDIVTDRQGALAVMEVEAFEPELFLRFDVTAGEKLAEAVLSR